jgi:hypothetical protein
MMHGLLATRPILAVAAVVSAAILLAASAIGQRGGVRDHQWPVVREFSYSSGVRLDYRRVDLDIPLYDIRGVIRYRLICRSGDQERRDELEQRAGVSAYLADMTCVLNVGNAERDTSLLSEDGTAAYYSRGNFNPRTILGTCAAYPEFGLVRHFRLRGFELTIALSDVNSGRRREERARAPDHDNPRVEYAVVTVSLRNDRAARTAKAEQSGYLDPRGDPRACISIRRGNASRMCRDPHSFSWRQCSPGWEYQRYPWEPND